MLKKIEILRKKLGILDHIEARSIARYQSDLLAINTQSETTRIVRIAFVRAHLQRQMREELSK